MSRGRVRQILALALPIVGGMVSQNVMNLVDTAMVGSLGDAALAAVGLAGFANFVAQAFLMGLSTGVQAMAARRKGEGRVAGTAVPLNGGLLLAAGIGLPLAAVLFALAPSLFPLLNDDPRVVALGVPYLRARLCAIAAVGMNFAFRGYWNGVSLSRLYMRTLVVMHACNIVLDYALIFGRLGAPRLGSTGAGIGTAVSTWLGTAMYVVLALRHARHAGFLRGLPDARTLRTMLRLAVPNGLQTLFFALGLTLFSSIVGRVGTSALAAGQVVMNLTLLAVLPALGLGLAAGSLVGQALGRGDPRDASRWGWEVVRVAVPSLALLGLPLALAPDAVLGVFLHDPATLALARWPLRLVGGAMAVEGFGMVLMGAQQGAGDTRRVMIVSVLLQWGYLLPVAWLVGPALGGGLIGIWLVQLGHRLLQASVYATLWRRGRWATIHV